MNQITKEHIDEYLMLNILERLDHIEKQIDDLIGLLNIKVSDRNER